ncbi:MAG: RdgB/HAM1 family non-canonical purine NTP pyrophosphatase [Calditrichia bacterium]
MKIAIATANEHKLKEIREILNCISAELLSLKDFTDVGEIAETGTSFRENALIKANALYQYCGLVTLADDSGLEVDALDGAPGIYSARYAGPGHIQQANNSKLLKELAGIKASRRTAQFRCVVAIVGDGYQKFAEGIVRGSIIKELRGSGGFGYDPLFVPDGYDRTFAEIGVSTKNKISHRTIAFRQACRLIEKDFSGK